MFLDKLISKMAPPEQKKPQQKKKGYNPYNKFKNRNWKKRKTTNEKYSSNSNDAAESNNHPVPSSPVKIVQTPISQLYKNRKIKFNCKIF